LNETNEIYFIVSNYFNVVESGVQDNYVEYVVLSSKYEVEVAFNKLYDELIEREYYPLIYEVNGVKVIKIFNLGAGRIRKPSLQYLPLALFIATLASTILTGYFIVSDYINRLYVMIKVPIGNWGIYYETSLFTICVLIPLLAHEFGHWFVAKRYRVPTSYPLLIPAPLVSPLGTFGAIVEMRFFPKNLIGLMMLGISGPLLGFITSYALFVINYLLSPRIPLDIAQMALSEGIAEPLGIAPLSALLTMSAFNNSLNEKYVVFISPAAFASLIMLIIHFMNLLPIGQLDGGHIIRSITSIKMHSAISHITALTVIILSLIYFLRLNVNILWMAFFALIALLLTGLRPHIGAANMLSNYVPKNIKAIVLIIYIILLILTVPIPSL